MRFNKTAEMRMGESGFRSSCKRLDALVEAQHVSQEGTPRNYLMKNRYDGELARVGDSWVITRNTVDNVWRSGDIAVLSGI